MYLRDNQTIEIYRQGTLDVKTVGVIDTYKQNIFLSLLYLINAVRLLLHAIYVSIKDTHMYTVLKESLICIQDIEEERKRYYELKEYPNNDKLRYSTCVMPYKSINAAATPSI